jgi:hypothetical protein
MERAGRVILQWYQGGWPPDTNGVNVDHLVPRFMTSGLAAIARYQPVKYTYKPDNNHANKLERQEKSPQPFQARAKTSREWCFGEEPVPC